MPLEVPGVKQPLTDQEYWNAYWSDAKALGGNSRFSKLKSWIKSLVGPGRIAYFARTYSDYVLWEGIYPRFLANQSGKSVIEIGSAPGRFLLRLKKEFGLDPYGVEYAAEGVEQNKAVFSKAGVPADHVLFFDAFGAEFLNAYRDRFDFVLSRGVIEHFDDPSSVINAHLDVLKPGGLLIITVPNYRGLNWMLKRTFDGASLPGHNLNTMKPEVFRKAFVKSGLTELHCGPFGSIDISMSRPNKRGGLLWALYMLLEKAQLPLNALMRMVWGTQAPNSRFTSPFLIYVGRKA